MEIPRFVRRLLPWTVGLFWLVFFLGYPYHELLDDSRYRMMLENKPFPYLGAFSRPLHHGLMYAQGWLFGASMEKAMALSLVLHLAVGFFAWRWLIRLRLPPKMRLPAAIGLLGFLCHPASLQTAAHVAQRSEILGLFFMIVALGVYAQAITRGARPWDFAWLALSALGAMGSKETYVFVPAALTVVLAWKSRSSAGKLAVASLLPIFLAGALANPFSGEVSVAERYRKTRAFRESVAERKPLADTDSTYLPILDRLENLRLQTALIKDVTQAVFVPFGLVKDYGYFPHGPKTWTWADPWFWLGLVALWAGGVLLWLISRTVPLTELVLIASPAIHWSIYWLFPVPDPLMLYRLYGVVFLTFCVSAPLLLQWSPNAKKIAIALAAVAVIGGAVRQHELARNLREAWFERERNPYGYRSHIEYLHALIDSPFRPVDCKETLEPALKLAPSSSLVYIEWAWCHMRQGKSEDAKTYARKSLEQEAVPENVRLALDYVMTGGGMVQFDKVHPDNLKILVNKDSGPPPGFPVPAPSPSYSARP